MPTWYRDARPSVGRSRAFANDHRVSFLPPRHGVSSPAGIVGHSGGFPGISSNLDIFKGSGYVAVVMSNYGGASQPVVEQIRALVKSRTTPTPAQ